MNIFTNRGETFLLHNSDNIVVFSCAKNLQVLCNAGQIYMDGTFQYCTKYFKQLFTIHAHVNGHYIPSVFCLLLNKSAADYEKTFNVIKDICSKQALSFSPKSIVIDFEKSIHIAVNIVWPSSEVIGCRFHLLQSWYRKIQELGLTGEYKDKTSEIGKWLGYTFGLPFLAPDQVGDCFSEDLVAFQPTDSRVIQYSDYLVEHYIDATSSFPPHIWAAASDSMARTTNACESFHNQFNSFFYTSHPSLFIFVDMLIKYQSENYIKIQSVHKPYKFQNSETGKRQNAIKCLLNLLSVGEIKRLQFVKSVSHYYAPEN